MSLTSYVFTNGDAKTPGRIPRREVAGMPMYLERGQMKWSKDLKLASEFADELRRFRVKVPSGRTDVDRAWREGKNDDLVLAVGMGVRAARTSGPCISQTRHACYSIDPYETLIDVEVPWVPST